MRRPCIFLLLLVIVVTSFGNVRSAYAEADCQTRDTSYTASAQIRSGRYTVYARLGKSTQQDSATLIGMSSTNSCILKGSAILSGTAWTPIVTFDTKSDVISFELQSPMFAHLPDANRPLLMLISKDNPACLAVDTECRATVANTPVTIQSPDIAEEHGALRILLPQPTDTLHVTQVKYYANDTLMYTTSSLTPFDERMIPYYATRTSRVVVYDNGQQATLSNKLPYVHADGPSQFIYRLWRQHEGVIITLGIILGLIILQQLIKIVVYFFYHERRWRYAHGFLRDHLANFTTAKERRVATAKFVIKKIFTVTERVLLYGLLVGSLVFFLLTFIIKFTHVEGESMHPTLIHGQLIYVNLAPASIAHLNRSSYIPQRGELVAAHPVFGGVVTTRARDELIVKRVIGLPGERVVVKNSLITVYNESYPDGFNPDSTALRPYAVTNDDVSQIDIDVTLANDEVFICGDNRPISIDSRDNGAISTSQIIGIVRGLPFGIK